MDKWIYVGIFLDEKSKKKLKKIYTIPDGWTEYFDHMTVIFNDGSDYAKDIKSITNKLEGTKVKLQVVSQGISDKAYAVHVMVPAGIPCGNKISHITLATSPTGKAVDSNYIENWIDITNKCLYVTGTLKTFVGK
jgi:hypothetical protein